MRKTLKASMAAILLSSVALVPASAIVTFASVDAAYAKSDKANGKANGNSSAAQEKTRGKSGASSGSSSSSNRGSGGGLGRLLDKLTGQDKRSTRSASASGKPAKGSGMHPSELGNMNGALNANINAVLAHIRNGNTNGPVGHLAAIAAAADGAIGAQDILDQELEFLALENALAAANYDSIEDYYAALDGVPGIDPIMAIDDAAVALAADSENTDLQDALDDALAFAGYTGDMALDDYEADVTGTPGAEQDTNLNVAIAGLGGDATMGEPIMDVRPAEEDIAGATEALEAQDDAEADILAYWNKNEDDPAVVTAEEQALLDKLYERLEGNEDAIADAVGEAEVDEEISGDVAECEGVEDCPEVEDIAELIE